MRLMYKAETTNGMYATMWNMKTGLPQNSVSYFLIPLSLNLLLVLDRTLFRGRLC